MCTERADELTANDMAGVGATQVRPGATGRRLRVLGALALALVLIPGPVFGGTEPDDSVPVTSPPSVPTTTEPGERTPVLVVSAEPAGDAVTEVDIEIPQDEMTASTTVFIREANGQAVAGLDLFTSSEPSGASVGIKVGGTEPASSMLQLAAGDGNEVDVEFTVTWNDYGSISVPVYARSGGVVARVATLQVARRGGPQLTVVGAANGALTIASSGERLSSAVVIAAGDRDANAVKVTLTPLRDTSTAQAYPFDNSTFDLGLISTQQIEVVELAANLPLTGSFTGTIRVEHDGIADPPVTLTINRSATAAHVTVDATTVSSSSGRPGWLGGETKVTRSIVLTETAGRVAVLAPPVLVGASTQQRETTVESTADVVATELDPDQPGCSTGAEGKPPLITVGPKASCRLEVTIRLDDPPGQYDGTLRFAVVGGESIDTKITIQYRSSWWIALFVIGVGIALGYLVHHVLRKRRAALEIDAEIDRLAAFLALRVTAIPGGLRSDREKEVAASLNGVIAALYDEPKSNDDDQQQVRAQVAICRTAFAPFPRWVAVRRAVVATDPPLQTGVDDLDEIAVDMGDVAATSEEAGKIGTRIDAVENAIVSHQKLHLNRAIEAIRDETVRHLDEIARADVTALLDQAAGFVAGDAAEIERATELLDESRRQLAEAHARAIGELLDRSADDLALTSSSWTRLSAEVQLILDSVAGADADTAVATVAKADARLMRGIIRLLQNRVRAEKPELGENPSPKDTEKFNDLEAIEKQLDEARQQVTAGQLAAARSTYADAAQGINAARVAGFLSADAVVEVRAIDMPPALTDPGRLRMHSVAPVADASAPPRTPAASKLRNLDSIAAIVAGLVGLLVGMVGLYDGNPTWGGLDDILLAVLWGVGVHEVTNSIGGVQGYAGAKTKLGV